MSQTEITFSSTPLVRDSDNHPVSAWSSNHDVQPGVDITSGLRLDGYGAGSWGYDLESESFYAFVEPLGEGNPLLVGGGIEATGRQMSSPVELVEPLCAATNLPPAAIVTQLGIASPRARLRPHTDLLQLMQLAINNVVVDDFLSIGRTEALRWVLIGTNSEAPASRCRITGPATPSPMTIEAERIFAASAVFCADVSTEAAEFFGGVADALDMAIGGHP